MKASQRRLRGRLYSIKTREGGNNPLDKKPREQLFDTWSDAIRWAVNSEPLEVVKVIDKIFAEEVLNIPFDRNAWYYDKKKVSEYVTKNIRVKRGRPFYQQD